MHLPILLALLTALSKGAEPIIKMMIVFGEPIGVTGEEVNGWEECIDTCWEQYDCVLVFRPSLDSDLCQLFRFDTVKRVKRETKGSGKIVGFKKMVPDDSCPSISSDPPFFGQFKFDSNSVDRTLYLYTKVTERDNEYTFFYSRSTCSGSSKIFRRYPIPVCLSVQWFPDCCHMQKEASGLCRGVSGYDLTGPASQDEYDYMKSELAAGVKSFDPRGPIRIWLGGKSVSTPKVFEVNDDTLDGVDAYQLYSGPKRNETVSDELDRCLYTSYEDHYIDDLPCTSVDGFVGAFCRTYMIIEHIPF